MPRAGDQEVSTSVSSHNQAEPGSGRAKEAQNLGIGSDPMKLVTVTQWVRAGTAPIPPD